MRTDTEPEDPVGTALSREPYLDDGGFTDRVMARLPPGRPRPRAAVVLGAALLSGAIGAVVLLGPGAGLVAALGAWMGAGGAVPVAALGAFGALAAGGALVAFAD